MFLLDPTVYDPLFVRGGGSAVEGATVFIDFTPLEEASAERRAPPLRAVAAQVSPRAAPSYFGLFAWSTTRPLVQQASPSAEN